MHDEERRDGAVNEPEDSSTNELANDSANPTDSDASRADGDEADEQLEAQRDEEYDVPGAALGVLSPEEAAAVLAAAESDPALAKDLTELQAMVAELARMAPDASINRGRSAGIRSRLVARAAATRAGRPVTRQSTPIASIAPARPSTDVEKIVVAPQQASQQQASQPQASPQPSHRPGGRPDRRGAERVSTERRTEARAVPPTMDRRGRFWKRALAGLAAAAVLLTAAGIFALWRERNTREVSAAAVVANANIATHDSLYRAVDSLRTQLAQRDSLIAALRNPHTRVVELASYMPPAPPARAFWDPNHQHLMITITGLKAPDPGRTYQLWVMARGHTEPVSAGTFTPDSSGRAEMTSEVPVESNQLRRVVVTDEPMGGSPAPTGRVLFAGR